MSPKPFVPAGTPSHYVPDRPVVLEHIRLELELDLPGRRLSGRATLTLRVRAEETKTLTLDAVEMDIRGVTIDGSPAASFDYDGERLRIATARTFRRDERLSVSVAYDCEPRRGLYFLGPDAEHPDRALQCWTQGQDEDARHFFPTLDRPIDKATTEVICTAPRDLFVLSNGDLRERRDVEGDRTSWHYALETPQPSYLVTLVCGPFVEIKDRAKETGVDVYYFVAPGREEDGRRSLGRTPAMIDLFSRKIGVPYPHRRYSQIVVPEFIFGGMENTTATTLTDQALLDVRAALDHDMDALVAHELAHQWWGDLLTCREWPEAWLNEGFATYFEYIWREHARGRDEADFELRNDAESYLAESGRYQRPIVCRQYEEPIEIFDAHLYEKGGRVLHMLRHELGDEPFWRTLRHYAERHAHGSVETRDLSRAIEEATGRNMDRFFEQWVRSPGHPELQGSWEWDDDRGAGTLRIEQKQDGDKVYSFSARVRFEVNGGEQEEVLFIRERTHAFEVRLPGKPRQVVFDPGDVILKTIKFDKSRPLWTRQLGHASLGIDRVLAAQALGERPEPASVSALREALQTDDFWAVRAAAATALGRTRRQDALEALLEGRDQEHPRVRRAVAAALGEYRDDERAAETLERWAAGGDPSYFVEAAAALSLGRTRSPRALTTLPRLLARPAFQDIIRVRAIEGLAATRAEGALSLLEAHPRAGASFQVRRALVSGVTALAEGSQQIRRAADYVETFLDDRDFRVRMEAAGALVTLGDPRVLPAMEAALTRELDGRARRKFRQAITDLRDRGKPPERWRKLQEEIERLRNETTKLRERVEKLEAARDVGKGGERPPKEPAPRPKRPRPRARRSTKPGTTRRRR